MSIPKDIQDKLDRAHAAAAAERDRPWKVQECYPRDQFEGCTLTVEQWLASTESSGFANTKAEKWRVLVAACALAHPGLESSSGLRQEPRVGYDPVGDQPFLLFKASHAGTTFLVSPLGIDMKGNEVEIA